MSPSLKFTIEKIRQQPHRIAKRVRERGVGEMVHWGYYQAAWRLRERRLGIDTLEHAYGINIWGQDGGQYYDPIDYRCLDTILDHMLQTPGHDVFLDYGCGLGRAVIAAAGRPFQRVVGVENNDCLLELCQKHVASATAKGRLLCPVEIIAADARQFEIPDDVTKILMYNTFVTIEAMRDAIDRIAESIRRQPREVTLVYVPLHVYDHFLNDYESRSGNGVVGFELTTELPTGFWDHVRILVYQSKIAASTFT